MQYVKALNLSYRYNPDEGKIVFEDGVHYTVYEALYLSRTRANEETIRAIHKIKGVFNAGIESPFGETLDGRPVSLPGRMENTDGNKVGKIHKKKASKIYPEAVQEKLPL